MVFYRKYRPQTIEELDSKEVREKLLNVLKSMSPPHAYLFSGPKGLGKTSAARILAKALNCESHNVILSKAKDLKNKRDSSAKPQNDIRDSVEPCNRCDQCVSITNGTNLDVLEIDGASNRGIDEIRDLREKVRLSAVSASKKVYIIDEVHMLTSEAFNALLKTLEEPPSHVVFILCTTETHKVPQTILSRCFHIQFKKATTEELVRAFERIAKKEKLKVEKDVLFSIAMLSDGSFRDGVKILEELSFAEKDGKITKELLNEKYKISSIKYQVSQMLSVFEKKDVKEGLRLVSKLAEQGIDMKFFMTELISYLHLLLMSKIGIGEQRESSLELDDIKKLADLVVRAISELKYAVLPELPLELVIVEWSLGQGFEGRGPVTPFPPASAEATAGRPASAALPLEASKRSGVGIPSRRATPYIDANPATPRDQSPDLLKELIDKVKTQNQSVAGVLRGCAVKSYDGKKFEIETNFKFHKERLNDQKARDIIEKAVSEITGKEIEVSIRLKPA